MSSPPRRKKSYAFEPAQHRAELLGALGEVVAAAKTLPRGPIPQPVLHRILRRYPKAGKGFFSRAELIAGYAAIAQDAGFELSMAELSMRLRLRPVRTHSGVTPITVLSKPFPCPGKCVFCPNDVRMPKSYLSDEPGCQRAEQNGFDPYLQTYNRMQALAAIGHNVDKVELIVLGGTWSFYPEPYQRWFIARCFEAMNDFGAKLDRRSEAEMQRFSLLSPGSRAEGRGEGEYNRTVDRYLRLLSNGKSLRDFEFATWGRLNDAQHANESGGCRCVGLVLETRPDYVTVDEVIRLRRLGCTKVQLGYQSLSDEVLARNKRGHDVDAIRKATALLRGSGFKILAHFMPNLLGATPASDIAGFRVMFEDPSFRPDELKVYPCSLIETAELMDFYERGEFRPYEERELLAVLCEVIGTTPRYCRLSRVIRDICSGDIVVGNRKSNFREYAERELDARDIRRQDIRSREVGGQPVSLEDLRLRTTRYASMGGEEVFLEYVTPSDRIAGFCRLRLPRDPSPLSELLGRALIRELHVYGVAQGLGRRSDDDVQHHGLGRTLLKEAERLARADGQEGLSVISAVGTRGYYRKCGFDDGELYQHRLFHADPG